MSIMDSIEGRYEDEIARLKDEIERLKDERDGFCNGQAQMQKICNDLQGTIKKYVTERSELKAEIAEQRTIIEQHNDWEYLTEIDKLKDEITRLSAILDDEITRECGARESRAEIKPPY